MIKGVNKRIIEVLNPEDECFEKIIFFVNPDIKQESSFLSRRTDEYLSKVVQNLKKEKKFSSKWLLAIKIGTAAVLTCTAATAALYFL